ncbi:MAG: tRNA (guanine-N1)-methyltransferase [Nitrosopumilus sp. H8]|nr:MAG: tRNA (guanine-N1)-methyltransferase [Nitrosopumilus sp. H13]RNJ78007.1 MAG: tRNA (guanine-N1)-methyltransferase [Nitrosopumilus sp. H8]
MLVPAESLTGEAPPRRPAFFNPRAAVTRDYSVLAYAALLDGFEGPRTLLDAMAGIGARGLRAANESGVDRVVLNDLNGTAVEIAKESAALNSLKGIEYSQDDACRFLAEHSGRGRRAAIVDVDPFGSPAAYVDCAARSVMHGGMLAVTATDLQVLNGLWNDACQKKYGGVPIRVHYGNEVAIRLVLGCVWSVCARLGSNMSPLFAESDMHYYRVYVRIEKKTGTGGLGYVTHCDGCGQREAGGMAGSCRLCGSAVRVAGPLWTGKMFDSEFVKKMISKVPEMTVDCSCQKTLEKCLAEAGMPGTYHTIDETASRARTGPPKLADAIQRLRESGHAASATSLDSTGFRTDADARQIAGALYPVKPRQT